MSSVNTVDRERRAGDDEGKRKRAGGRAQQLTLSMHTTPLIVPPKQHIRTLTQFQSDRDKTNPSSIVEPYTDQTPHIWRPHGHVTAIPSPNTDLDHPSSRPYGYSLTTTTPYTDQTPPIWRPHGYLTAIPSPNADLDHPPRRPYGQSLTTTTPYTDQIPPIWRPYGFFVTNTTPYADLDLTLSDDRTGNLS